MAAAKIDGVVRARIRTLLAKAFGSRLRGIVLYAIIDALYPLQLELVRPLHALPVDAQAYADGEFSLYRNARREGVLV